MNNRRQQTGD